MGLTRLFGGASGITNQPQGLDIGIGSSNIKSIQQFAITMNAGIGSVDTAISTVNSANTIALLGNQTNPSSNLQLTTISATVTTNTNLNLSRVASGSPTLIVYVTVVEFQNIKSIQKGAVTKNSSSASVTASITPVVLNKSILFYDYTYGTSVTTSSQTGASGRASATNTLTFEGNTTTVIFFYYAIIEFN